MKHNEKYQFIVGVYDHALKSGEWTVVKNRTFNDEDAADPPPMCNIDSTR